MKPIEHAQSRKTSHESFDWIATLLTQAEKQV